METKKCKHCLSDLDKEADLCTVCHKDQRSWINRHPALSTSFVFLGLPLIILFVTGLFGGDRSVSSPDNIQALVGSLGMLVFVLLLIALYFLPAILASRKKKKNSTAILLTNIFFGWTFIGWIIALIWAATND